MGESKGDQRAWPLPESVSEHPRVKEWLSALDGDGIPRRRLWLSAIAILIVLVTAVLIGYRSLRWKHYETAVGEQRDVLLTDSSRLILNTNTSLAVRYTDGIRLVNLDHGEVLFKTLPESRRPFRVVGRPMEIETPGADFVVQLTGDKVMVGVFDGTVLLRPERHTGSSRNNKRDEVVFPAMVRAAQSIQCSMELDCASLGDSPLTRVVAWRAREIRFSDTPLSDAVHEFNRYVAVPLEIGAPELEAVRVSAVFSIEKPEVFVDFLATSFSIQAHAEEHRILLMPVARPTCGASESRCD